MIEYKCICGIKPLHRQFPHPQCKAPKHSKIRCYVCGGINMTADPAGYYYDGTDEKGKPYLCLDCRK